MEDWGKMEGGERCQLLDLWTEKGEVACKSNQGMVIEAKMSQEGEGEVEEPCRKADVSRSICWRKETTLLLTVGSKFKRKIEKERKIGRRIQTPTSKCIRSLGKHVTEEWVAVFLVFSHFPASAFLFVSLEPDFDGDSEQQLTVSGSGGVTSRTCNFFLPIFLFFKCLPGGSSWVGWFWKAGFRYLIQKDWSAKAEWHLP